MLVKHLVFARPGEGLSVSVSQVRRMVSGSSFLQSPCVFTSCYCNKQRRQLCLNWGKGWLDSQFERLPSMTDCCRGHHSTGQERLGEGDSTAQGRNGWRRCSFPLWLGTKAVNGEETGAPFSFSGARLSSKTHLLKILHLLVVHMLGTKPLLTT